MNAQHQPQPTRANLPGLAGQAYDNIDWQYWSRRMNLSIDELQRRYAKACLQGWLAAEMARATTNE